jgi:O2-independent ubiquinone biosynthesis protein UbiV
MKSQLTLGPILFYWPVEEKRDFYFRIADEANIDTVYLGEVVCSKRIPFTEQIYPEVIERLQAAGKKIVLSTLAEVTIKYDSKSVESICAMEDILVEANDGSALSYLSGRPHAIGPFINVYSEDTLSFLASKGAIHVTLPPELPSDAIATLGKKARELGVTLETQVYGRIPLALSTRCYHARAHGHVKDTCQFVCEQDPDGMVLKTLKNESFLTINGIQTLSHSCLNLLNELNELKTLGVNAFRLSPHNHDMIQTTLLYRDVLDGKISASEASSKLEEIGLAVPHVNGFYHRQEGHRWLKPSNL